jgi:hypothetical protein
MSTVETDEIYNQLPNRNYIEILGGAKKERKREGRRGRKKKEKRKRNEESKKV